MKKITILLALSVSLVIVAGCGKDDPAANGVNASTLPPGVTPSTTPTKMQPAPGQSGSSRNTGPSSDRR